MEPEHWRTTRDVKNVRAYIEYERERAKLHREFAAADAYELMDDEPEQQWWSPPKRKHG